MIRGALLTELLLDLRGHPRLSRCEEAFVGMLQNDMTQEGPEALMTHKQMLRLGELVRKILLPENSEEGEP